MFAELSKIAPGNYNLKKSDHNNLGNPKLGKLGPWREFKKLAALVPRNSENTQWVLGINPKLTLNPKTKKPITLNQAQSTFFLQPGPNQPFIRFNKKRIPDQSNLSPHYHLHVTATSSQPIAISPSPSSTTPNPTTTPSPHKPYLTPPCHQSTSINWAPTLIEGSRWFQKERDGWDSWTRRTTSRGSRLETLVSCVSINWTCCKPEKAVSYLFLSRVLVFF